MIRINIEVMSILEYHKPMHIYLVMIFSVPNQNSSSTLSSEQGTTKAPPSQNTTSDGIFDPGGEKCDPTPIEDELVITIQVMRYTTMALSAIFLVEVRFDKLDFLIFFLVSWGLTFHQQLRSYGDGTLVYSPI